MEGQNHEDNKANIEPERVGICTTDDLVDMYREYCEECLDEATTNAEHRVIFLKQIEEIQNTQSATQADLLEALHHEAVLKHELHLNSLEYCTAELGRLLTQAIGLQEQDPSKAIEMVIEQLSSKNQVDEHFELVSAIRKDMAELLEVEESVCRAANHRVIVLLKQHLRSFTKKRT